MTELNAAKNGKITQNCRICAQAENVEPEILRGKIADGKAVICASARHKNEQPFAVGEGLKVKVNANIGTSPDRSDLDFEIEKLQAALDAKTDAMMDLSTGGDLREIRKTILENCPVPVGSVPIYQVACRGRENGTGFVNLCVDDFFDVIEEQAEDGISFVTVHCGVTRDSVSKLEKQGRILGVVSRGGALTVQWMRKNKAENPYFEHYDRLLEIAKKYDLVLSLGDGLRPGCLADATDRGQVTELVTLGELARRAYDEGVQVMIEGPGHVPLADVAMNMRLEKKLTNGAPFYVLGPLVTDIAPGYDHIVGAIGGAIAAMAGADFLCYVTPSEHLRLPDAKDVYDGVIASRIAGHAADIAKGIPGAREIDDEISRARAKSDWDKQIELAINPALAMKLRESSKPADGEVCTMCGEFCAIKVHRGIGISPENES
ncbi:MAG: phosphomethylpyrimidine synthase ThiC [Planctomycetota bacterium]|jgi:phosphomethylpyrimidine synthase